MRKGPSKAEAAKPKPATNSKPKGNAEKKKTQTRQATRAASGNGAAGSQPRRKPDTPPSTPATPSTPNVAGVAGVEGKPEFVWEMDAGLPHNFRAFGSVLAQAVPDLHQFQDSGLLLVANGRPKRITSAKELSPLLIDSIRISVWKSGKFHAELPTDGILNKMLASQSFLKNFRKVEEVVTTPIVLADFTPSQPGYNEQGGLLYLGPAVEIGNGTATIDKFLDVMEFDSNASRTNAVAAALTVLFRHHWPGGKPMILLTANKSQSGKGTLMNFIRGRCPKVDIRYQNKDWPLEQSLQRQLQKRPEAGVITFDNVRLGSAGGGREINTALFESIITDTELVLSAASVKQMLSEANKYVVLLNTNEGLLSIDLLNRSLTSHLIPTGDLEERLDRMKKELGGLDVKLEWLPANQAKIEAELWGMIDRWDKAGKPLDDTVQFQMAPWAKTIGGILMVNGYKDFLGNFKAVRAAVSPIRQAIADLAFYASDESRRRLGGKPLPTTELAKLVTDYGLHKDLLVDGSNAALCAKMLGERLTAYIGETFTAQTAGEKITYKLSKKATHWDGKKSPVQRRYIFEEISRQKRDDQGGRVLEEPQVIDVLQLAGNYSAVLAEAVKEGVKSIEEVANED